MDFARTMQAPSEIHVLHEGNVPKPAEATKGVPPDKERLVAVRQCEDPDSCRNSPLDQARPTLRRCDAKPEVPSDDLRIARGRFQLL